MNKTDPFYIYIIESLKKLLFLVRNTHDIFLKSGVILVLTCEFNTTKKKQISIV